MKFESSEYREESLKRKAIRHITSAASFFEKIGGEVLEIQEEQAKRRMSPESGLLSSLAVKDLEETAKLIRKSSPEKSYMCAELAKEKKCWIGLKLSGTSDVANTLILTLAGRINLFWKELDR